MSSSFLRASAALAAIQPRHVRQIEIYWYADLSRTQPLHFCPAARCTLRVGIRPVPPPPPPPAPSMVASFFHANTALVKIQLHHIQTALRFSVRWLFSRVTSAQTLNMRVHASAAARNIASTTASTVRLRFAVKSEPEN